MKIQPSIHRQTDGCGWVGVWYLMRQNSFAVLLAAEAAEEEEVVAEPTPVSSLLERG